MVDERRVQVGYNEEEIRTFIPISRRYQEFKQDGVHPLDDVNNREHE